MVYHNSQTAQLHLQLAAREPLTAEAIAVVVVVVVVVVGGGGRSPLVVEPQKVREGWNCVHGV